MKRLAITVTLALVLLMVAGTAALAVSAAPAGAQETVRDADSWELDRDAAEDNIAEAEAEAAEAEAEAAEMAEQYGSGSSRERSALRDVERAEDRRGSAETERDAIDAAISARDGYEEEHGPELETTEEDLRDTEAEIAYQEALARTGDSDAEDALSGRYFGPDGLYEIREDLEAEQKPETTEEQTTQEEPEEEQQDQGGAVAGGDGGDSGGGNGDDGSSSGGDSGDGPLATASSTVSSIVWGLVSLATLGAVVLGGMFAWAYRRDRDPRAAWESIKEPKRLGIAAAVTLVLSALGGWSTIFALGFLLLFLGAIFLVPIIFLVGLFTREPGMGRAETFGTGAGVLFGLLWGGRDTHDEYDEYDPAPSGPTGPLPRPPGAGPEPTVGGSPGGERVQNDGSTNHRKGPPPEPEKRELTDDLRERLKNMEQVMAESIVGQEEAVREVSTAMRRRIAGQFQGEQPASFLFLGPTGVGKTEVANTLADEMYGGKEEMIRLDMSEYKSDADIARLTGAPAGYIGHDASNPLTDKMYENPERVVLFDEIEKAHQDVFNVFLQILDAGRLTDGHGNVIPFQYSSVILTSNLLTREITQIKADGGQIDNAQIKQALIEQGIKPEIVNRLGRIVVFDALSMDDVREVAKRMLKKPAKSMQERHGVSLSFSEAAISRIAELGYEPEFGARPLRAVIEREVEDRLSDLLLDNKVKKGDAVELDAKDDGTLGVRPARRSPR